MKHLNFRTTFLILAILLFTTTVGAKSLFNDGWKFAKAEDITNSNNPNSVGSLDFDDSTWESVKLPHTAHLEPLITIKQWQGVCWYRKRFTVSNYSADKKYTIEVEAAMNHTTMFINGQQVACYEDGYLPIVVDATPYLTAGENVVAFCLDNRDNERTGPKPMDIMGFNMYSGLYRNAWFSESGKTYITHPILANRAASGGVFITTPEVSEAKSTIQIKTNVANEQGATKDLKLTYSLYDGEKLVAQSESKVITADRYEIIDFEDKISISNAKLWSPDSPNLYTAKVELMSGEQLLDSKEERFGIRKFEFKDNQLYINGVKTFLRGVNRHQEYPYIGYALSDNAQYRDAKRIKDGGFDYIRLSHYPHSTAFMNACDELGLVVVDAILGWQFYRETAAFKEHSYEAARRLVRRDRNHPCVMAWEVSLNETFMPVPFMSVLNKIVHEEYPGDNVYSCGWMPDVYDIYFQARQHRIGHPERVTFEKPYMVSEYGDWEYYSTNEGLNQHNLPPEKRVEHSSRQERAFGESRLLQQVYNLQEAHNDNQSIPATADSYWVMYDYNTGYGKELDTPGVMDMFRLPKFAYYLFQSQRSGEPMVEIASYWNEKSPTNVKVFSNCDKVALYLNNRLIAKQSPDSDAISNNLNHPPFTFNVGKFKRGRLKAVGYVNGKAVTETIVKSPERATKLKFWTDEDDRPAEAGCKDVVFLYVAAVDKNGTICTDFDGQISITVDSRATILNTDGVKTEAGIAAALLQIGDQKGDCIIKAHAGGKLASEHKLKIM